MAFKLCESASKKWKKIYVAKPSGRGNRGSQIRGFLRAALAYKKGLHIRLEFVVRSLGPRGRKNFSLFVDFALLGFSICAVYYGYQLTEKTLNQINLALGWPVAWSYGVIPVSGAAFLLFAAEKILHGLSEYRTEES